ncbi:MAG: hypothetical protein AAF826_01415 [Pseudomonadota bacterium]
MATREVHDRQLVMAVQLAANMARVVITDEAVAALVSRAMDAIYSDYKDEPARDAAVDRATTVTPKMMTALIEVAETRQPIPALAGSDAGGEKLPLVVTEESVEAFFEQTEIRFHPFTM